MHQIPGELVTGVNGISATAGLPSQWKFAQQTIVLRMHATEPWHIIGTDNTAAIGNLEEGQQPSIQTCGGVGCPELRLQTSCEDDRGWNEGHGC